MISEGFICNQNSWEVEIHNWVIFWHLTATNTYCKPFEGNI